jgi:hypothetical protein
MIKFELSSKNQNLGTHVSTTMNLKAFQLSATLLMSSAVILMDGILILFNELPQHLNNLHNSVNEYFPNNQCNKIRHL